MFGELLENVQALAAMDEAEERFSFFQPRLTPRT
jgi:hypothetical protein